MNYQKYYDEVTNDFLERVFENEIPKLAQSEYDNFLDNYTNLTSEQYLLYVFLQNNDALDCLISNSESHDVAVKKSPIYFLPPEKAYLNVSSALNDKKIKELFEDITGYKFTAEEVLSEAQYTDSLIRACMLDAAYPYLCDLMEEETERLFRNYAKADKIR